MEATGGVGAGGSTWPRCGFPVAVCRHRLTRTVRSTRICGQTVVADSARFDQMRPKLAAFDAFNPARGKGRGSSGLRGECGMESLADGLVDTATCLHKPKREAVGVDGSAALAVRAASAECQLSCCQRRLSRVQQQLAHVDLLFCATRRPRQGVKHSTKALWNPSGSGGEPDGASWFLLATQGRGWLYVQKRRIARGVEQGR